ncbi:MAG TPA: PAS domain-containing protein [Elusimicrobiota bacterium]|nr:PAS domain-containing protein [Elusimicrobiota bacterium]
MQVAYLRPGKESWPAPEGAPKGWTVERFSGAEALESRLQEKSFDAVVLRLDPDAGLFGELLSRLRVAAPGLPVVVAAAAAQESGAAAALAAGAADYWLESMTALRLRASLEQAALRRRITAAQQARDEALERIDDAVVVTDASERIVYWNRGATRLYGYDYAEVVGRLLPDTLSPHWLDAETRRKAWRAVAERGLWLGETTHTRRDGAPARVSVEISLARDGRGRGAGLLLVARPAGAAAPAEAPAPAGGRDQKDARVFLESILNVAADPIFVKDREHRYLLVNDAFCAVGGRPREEFLGRTDAELFGRDLSRTFMSEDDRVIETGRERVSEQLFTDPQGMMHMLITKKTLGRDADGRPVLVGVSRDVTEKVKAIEDLRRSEERLHHAQKLEAVGRLAGGVAHDFNNILTAIVGCAGILLESLPPGHPCREDAEEIRRAGEQAAALTRQLLSFSRRDEAAARVLDLRAVCGGMRKMLQRLMPAGIELEMSIPDRLGAVRIDPGQAEQVLLNLVVNAGDAMPDGGRIAVALADAPDGGAGLRGPCVCLTVSDDGVGMDEPTRQRIFDPFFTTKKTGTGLGLANVRDAVARGGGAVAVESEPSRGSTFRVYWPMCAETPDAPGSAAPARRAGRPARLLVVEDDDVVRRFVVRGLERDGYSVQTAADGAEALRISDANEGAFDAVIVDVVLPRVRGAEVAARLRASQPTARVLFVSGYRAEESSLPAGSDGQVRFLAKPFTAAALAEKVRELLDGALP